ncbi:hypothetical protein [Streptomyces sp. NBC_00878]|uniref:hypothetical protein n=1 Tax=Streptomyces sp. NBC_00878 TaxID=2975854 RepID=UPI0022534351|nr:hypothetical protein [Streptomyces sp. NBC_00878]MCX4908423.1 hypothetical protein [Streptomyces sp. NBC_00878]
MGSLRLTLCAGAVAATALAPLAPAAYAADGGVSVTPGSPTPGSDIQLRVQGCTGMSGTAASEAFVADAQLTGSPGVLTGETRVRSTLDPGTYDVRVTCDGFEDKVKGTVTVPDKKQQEKQKQKQEKQEQKKQEQKKQEQKETREQGEKKEKEKEKEPDDSAASPVAPVAPASPVAPVQAGGGGTARLAVVDARAEGPGTGHAVVGLVLAGVAAVVVVVRSARRGRGSAGGGTGGTD